MPRVGATPAWGTLLSLQSLAILADSQRPSRLTQNLGPQKAANGINGDGVDLGGVVPTVAPVAPLA